MRIDIDQPLLDAERRRNLAPGEAIRTGVAVRMWFIACETGDRASRKEISPVSEAWIVVWVRTPGSAELHPGLNFFAVPQLKNLEWSITPNSAFARTGNGYYVCPVNAVAI